MTDSNVEPELLHSDAFQSLSMERRICDVLQSLNWKAVHSCYYKDPITDKMREIDVSARQLWERNLKNGDQAASLHLLTEAKSAKGYHLIFSSSYKNLNLYPKNDGWIGKQGVNYKRIAQTIEDAGLSLEKVSFILNKLEKMAYPGGIMLPYRMAVDPLPTQFLVSAFRETNIGNEKELENSVLWRASQALLSAVVSLKERHLENCLEDLSLIVSLAIKFRRDPTEEALEQLRFYIRTVDIYHPVVVIDAPLWLIQNEKIKSIEWCRFVQVDPYGLSEWWVDVVNTLYFEKFAKEISSYYNRKFRKIKSKIR